MEESYFFFLLGHEAGKHFSREEKTILLETFGELEGSSNWCTIS